MKQAQLIGLLCVGLLLASIGNGAVGYMKRVGLIEQQTYASFMATYCGDPGANPESVGDRCWCIHEPTPQQAKLAMADSAHFVTPYQDAGYQRWLKVGKDAVFAVFLLMSLYLIGRQKAPLPGLADSWPAMLLALIVSMGFAISLVIWGGSFAIVGMRSFEFLAIVLLGGWAVGGMHHFARCLGWLLIIEAVLVVFELIHGMPMRACPRWFRAAGTMVLPSSLGIASVVALAFYASFSLKSSWLPFLIAVSVALIVASGSGTGLVALFALLGVLALQRTSGSRKWMALTALLLSGIVVLVELPALTHRSDIYDSLFAAGGRTDKLRDVVQAFNATDLLIGRGLGYGTNTATNLAALATAPTFHVAGATEPFYADSTVTVMLMQLGIIGVAAFYGLLIWAFWRDPVARPIYAVVLISSLMISICEVFPVNFTMGLALAHTLAMSRRKQAAS
jgi:hypothetical protein